MSMVKAWQGSFFKYDQEIIERTTDGETYGVTDQ